MTNISKISPDDPRLTAFALGELEGEDLAAVEAALRDDPAARAAVAEIRATAAQLEAALGAEAAADLVTAGVAPFGKAAILPGKDPAKLDGGSLAKLIRFPQLKFPQLYYLVGGLAAAAFAILVIRHEPPAARMEKHYVPLSLQPVAAEAARKSERLDASETEAAAKGAARARDKKSDENVAAPAPVTVALPVIQDQGVANSPATSDELKELPQASGLTTVNEGYAQNARRAAAAGKPQEAAKDAEKQKAPVASEPVVAMAAPVRPEPSNTILGPASGGVLANTTDEGVQTMSKFSVAAPQDNGYLKTNSGTATRIGMEVQRAPLAVEIKSAEFLAETNPQSLTDALRYTGDRSGSSSPRLRGQASMNTEAYAYQRDSDFLGAAENPLSTFSIDVDTASYANVRRFLTEGRLPPPDAVRIEELVNYFPYHYAPPEAGEQVEADKAEGVGRSKTAPLHSDEVNAAPFAASMEVADAPWAPGHRLVRIGLKGREVSGAARGAANLVFLLDVSGSMDEPNKLPLVKEAMRLLIGKLRPDDRVAIVVYAGNSGLALPSTPVAKSREILDALDSLTPGGSTNGAMGIQLAYDIAKANFVPGGLNRVILCTDGDFNVGVTSEGGLTRLIKEKAKSGVFLTVLGFGMGNYKDATLEQLADQGNGNYGYVDSRREAEKLLVEQVNGTLVTIAKDVKLQVEFNPAQVASYRLIGYEDRLLKKEDFNNDAVDAGEIGAGHTVTALYEIVPASLAKGEGPGATGTVAVDKLKYGPESRRSKVEGRAPETAAVGMLKEGGDNRQSAIGNPHSAELLTLKVRFKEPAGTVSRKLEFPLTDGGARFADASADFKFAAAVAEFGMILRDSPHKGSGTLADVLAWAQAGTDSDAGGYRAEFIGLVRRAETLMR